MLVAGLITTLVFPAYAGVSLWDSNSLSESASIPRLCGGEPIPIATEAVLH